MFKKQIDNKIHILNNEQLFKLIDANTEIVVIVPWNGAPIPITIKMLDYVSLTSCGDFNTISEVIVDKNEKATLENIIKTKNIHENMLKLALVHPTFKEFEEHLMTKDFYKNIKKEIKEVEDLIAKLTSTVEKEELTKELDKLELAIAFLFPEDFTLTIVGILMQKNATDINKLTKETLLQAGFLGEKYNVRPSEYLKGIFTDKQKVDIDVTALTLVADYREAQKIEKSNFKWIGRKNG